MSRKILRAATLSLLVLSLVSGAAAEISVDIRDSEGDDLDSFDLTVSGDQLEIERQNIDSTTLDLDEGEYELQISKTGYTTLDRTIFVEDGEDSSYRFTMQRTDEEETGDIRVSNLQAPESICRGESFSATVKVENQGEEDRVISMTGTGFGNILLGQSFVVEAGESKRYRFIFTGVDETGEKSFRITASSRNSDSVDGTVEVGRCTVPGDPATVTNIDLQLYPLGGNNKAFVHQVVRVKGFADGAKGSVPLDLSVDGEKIATINTDPGGYFQTYFRPGKAGKLTVTVSATETSSSEQLVVEPSASVGNIRAPEKVFSGDEFRICGDVNSVITPKVVLLENGEVVESRLSRGEVCFDINAPAAGEYSYEMRALTYGEGGSAEIGLEVLEQGSQAGSFPGQIATVETEPGILKVSLYNTNDQSTNYTARLEGFDQSWVSDSEKTVSLNKGERETVYFYVSPGRSGSFNAILEVESDGEIIYSDDVEMFSADSGPVTQNRDFLEIYLKLLRFFV